MAPIWQSKHWPKFTYDAAVVEAALARTAESLGEISGLHLGLSAEESTELHLRQIVEEAIASFGIEGVALDPAQVERSVVASLRARERASFSHRSDAIAALMIEARRGDAPLTADMLQSWHRLLFYGVEIEDRGTWRQSTIEIVRSAAPGRHDVLFRPPPPEQVPHEMTQFLTWLNSETSVPVAIRAGLAHLWFETIHPFSDGNGRIGRALIEHSFARVRALPFSLSRRIEIEKRAYYQALQDGRGEGANGIDATPFLMWFLGCLNRAADAARDEVQFLLRRNRYFARFSPQMSDRAQDVLRRLFAMGSLRLAEGISARSYARIAKVSGATATRDLGQLVQIGAIVRTEAGGRSTHYDIAAL